MLKLLKIAMAQMEVVPGHPDVNTATILRFIEEARAKGADVVIFPEMAVPGYFLGDTWEQSAFLRDCESYGRDIIAASKDITVMFGNVAIDWQKKNNDGRVRKYNAFFIARDGELVQPDNMPYPYTIKTLMPNYREFDDTRHFFSLQKLARELGTTPSKLLSPVTLKIRGQRYRAGCLLCEDGWSDDYEVAPFELLEKEHLDFYVNISASPYTLGKNDKRNRVFGRQAREAGVPLFYVNCIGLQNNGKTVYTFDGSSTAYNEKGDVVRTLPEYEEALTVLPLAEMKDMAAEPESEEKDIAHIYRALHYGIRRFLENIHMKKIVIGISGGLDSSLALLVAVRAMKQLGRPTQDVLAVTMPCFGTTHRTRSNAEILCEELGVTFQEIPIARTVHSHFADIGQDEAVLDVTYENCQARVRTLELMDLANRTGGLVVGTGDLSELALGWATYNGDHMSMYGVNADVPKTLVRHIVRYAADAAENETLRAVLLDILDTPVSPELLPANENGEIAQQTESLVGPYELHDFYLYDWHNCSNITHWHGFKHARIARYNAETVFKLTDKEKDIIQSHMWPLSPTDIPHSREAALVCMADKMSSSYETVLERKAKRKK